VPRPLPCPLAERQDGQTETMPETHLGWARLAVLAGHFQWGVWGEPLFTAPAGLGRAAPVPRVFVMLREPVERTISFYYERVAPYTKRSLNDLAADDLDDLLAHFRGSAFSRWRDEGLADTACKMLLGLNVHKGRRPEEVPPGTAEAAAAAVDPEAAVARLSLSVVGLLHRWEETKRVLAWWFPWVDLSTDDVRGNTGRKDGSVETPAALLPSHRTRIEEANRCDLALYAAAVHQFDRQLAIVASVP